MDDTTEPAEVWAVCEMMGHVRWAGRLAEVERYGGKLARLDIPQDDGTFITKLFGAGAVYAITFVTEVVARQVAKASSAAPVQPWDFPKDNPKAINNRTDPAHQYRGPHADADADDDRDDTFDPSDPDMPRW